MGSREWAIVIAVVLIVTALLWAAARWRKRRYDNIYSYDPSEEGTDLIAEYGSELPSGGARTVGYRGPEDAERKRVEIKERTDQQKPRLGSSKKSLSEQSRVSPDAASNKPQIDNSEQQTTAADTTNPAQKDTARKSSKKAVSQRPVEVQVPLLLDPSDEHSFDVKTVLGKTHRPPVQQELSPSTLSAGQTDASDQSTKTQSRMVDTETVTEKTDRTARKSAGESAAESTIKQNEEADKTPKKTSSEKSRSKNARGKHRGKHSAEGNDETPPEVIIVNLMTTPENAYEGQALMRALTESGMRFGDMDIFHFCGKHGDEEPQFSMANLLNPGVFDIDRIAEVRTHGLCFFFELIADSDNMAIYESMLSVISAIKDELGGEMRDDQRSVFTIQTSEHCRNRIRDFQRRHLLKPL